MGAEPQYAGLFNHEARPTPLPRLDRTGGADQFIENVALATAHSSAAAVDSSLRVWAASDPGSVLANPQVRLRVEEEDFVGLGAQVEGLAEGGVEAAVYSDDYFAGAGGPVGACAVGVDEGFGAEFLEEFGDDGDAGGVGGDFPGFGADA